MEFILFEICEIKSDPFFHTLHRRAKESIGRQEKLKEEQRHRRKVRSPDCM